MDEDGLAKKRWRRFLRAKADQQTAAAGTGDLSLRTQEKVGFDSFTRIALAWMKLETMYNGLWLVVALETGW